MHGKRNIKKLSMVIALGTIFGTGGAYGYRQIASRWLITQGYLQTHPVRKLQIGAGGYELSGWLNTDIEPSAGEAFLDATKPFPLPDGSLSYIFSEHVIEHLSYEQGLNMLAECYRTLKPGGKVRITTPNLQAYVQLFTASKTDAMKSYIQERLAFGDAEGRSWLRTISPEAMILNMEMRSYGHRFIYDPATLEDSLRRAKFTSVTQFRPGESDDPQLSNIEMRPKTPLRSMNDFEAMVLQATRP
jgi:predicted SAM-dependent methyltransferase